MLSNPTRGVTAADARPTLIQFDLRGVWVLRITLDGVESNPEVLVDDGAKAIFDALKPYLLSLKS